ncbi:MAG: alpha/beta fold hydrolase [Shimia sp.]
MKWKTLASKLLILFALLLLGGCVAVTQTAVRKEAAAERAFPPEGELIEIGGTTVHYVQRGSGPDIVLIHGAGGNTRDWTFAFTDRLTDRYRVTVFDRPGLGYTDRMPGYAGAFESDAEGPGEQAALLASAAAELGVENPVVVGHSYGGAVALAWALDHPAAAIVSVAGVANPWPGDLGAYYTVQGSSLGGGLIPPVITALATEERIEETIQGIFRPQSPPEGYADYIGGALSARRESLRANARQVNTLRPHVVEMQPRYPGLDLPVEIVHGAADETVPLNIHSGPLAQAVPGANLVVLDGIGHMPHHTNPEEVEAAIDRAAARAGLR